MTHRRAALLGPLLLALLLAALSPGAVLGAGAIREAPSASDEGWSGRVEIPGAATPVPFRLVLRSLDDVPGWTIASLLAPQGVQLRLAGERNAETGEIAGRATLSHSGSQRKTATYLLVCPEARLAIALMTNGEGTRLSGFAEELMTLLLEAEVSVAPVPEDRGAGERGGGG